MCFIKCGAQSLGAILEGQKVMYLSHGRVPYQTALFNDTILLHILYGSHVHILNKNYQNAYSVFIDIYLLRLQGYQTPSCIDSLCVISVFVFVALYSH